LATENKKKAQPPQVKSDPFFGGKYITSTLFLLHILKEHYGLW
jgi:hypothetical protein